MGGVRGCWSPRSDPGLDWGVLVLVLEDTEDDPEAVEDELNGPVFDTTVLTLVAVKQKKIISYFFRFCKLIRENRICQNS